jgi:copper(I)-binding protein
MRAYAAAVTLAFALASAAAVAAAPVSISEAWSRPAADTGVVYAIVANAGEHADLIDGARSPIARAVELHRSMNVNDMATMKPVYALSIPAHGAREFTPGGDHIMLIGLKHELKPGESFPLDVHFKSAGWQTVTVAVRPIVAPDAAASVSPEFSHARLTEGVSQSQIALDAAVFVLGFLILGGILVYIGKRIFTAKDQ